MPFRHTTPANNIVSKWDALPQNTQLGVLGVVVASLILLIGLTIGVLVNGGDDEAEAAAKTEERVGPYKDYLLSENWNEGIAVIQQDMEAGTDDGSSREQLKFFVASRDAQGDYKAGKAAEEKKDEELALGHYVEVMKTDNYYRELLERKDKFKLLKERVIGQKNRRTEALMVRKEWTEARKEANEVLKLDPNNKDAKNYLSEIQKHSRRGIKPF